VARRALGGVQVVQGDLRDLGLQPCSVIVMFDVLHYLDSEEQQRLIEKPPVRSSPEGCCCCAKPMPAQDLHST